MLILPIALSYVLYGGQFGLEKIVSILMFLTAILLGYLLAKRPIQNKHKHLISVAILSLGLGIFEGTMLSSPKAYLIRLIGQSVFTFIGIYWIGAGILKREKKRR